MDFQKRIYKKDTSGKIRFLTVLSNETGVLTQISGVEGTPNPITHQKQCYSKNIGKSNETTPQQQAYQEAESLIASKMTEGYFNSPEECQVAEVILPMLAKDYKKESKKIKYGTDLVFVQPKLDGMRCLAFLYKDGRVILMSRTGKEIEGLDHIRRDLAKVKFMGERLILDGELYVHGESFQKNMEYVKSYKAGLTERISYWIYDMVDDAVFSSRKVRPYIMGLPSLNEVQTYQVETEQQMKEWHDKFMSEGFEGTMIRLNKLGYKIHGRSSELLKYKDFQDLALVIKDIEPADSRPDWAVPVFEWKGAPNNELRAGMKYSHADRVEMLLHKEDYIGKTAELRFFEYSDTGVPRFPVMVGIRNDK